MQYHDQQYGTIDLTLIDKSVKTSSDESTETSTEIYKMPSDDVLIFTTLNFLKVKTVPFKNEFYFDKRWLAFFGSNPANTIELEDRTVTLTKVEGGYEFIVKFLEIEKEQEYFLKNEWLDIILEHFKQTTTNE
jgi:hypothetical protein